MKTKAEIAVDIFLNGFNCSQAVFSSHSEEYGLSETVAKKIACGFGAGMGYNCEVCGAVSGALMVIGLKYGKYMELDNPAKEKTYKLVKEFTDNFKKEYGTINCRQLIKYDLGIEEQLLKARELGVFKEICPAFVKKSVEILEEILKK